jgi:tRNA nucleotidyltransferase (CCA-adding enzyme)
MTGVSFANRLTEFLKSNKNEFVKDPITVEANPDQSKHLETAKMKLWGIELDLVNLRAEEYSEDSRIPNQTVRRILRDSPFPRSLIPSVD